MGRCPRDLTADLVRVGVTGGTDLAVAENGDIVGTSSYTSSGRGFRVPAGGTAHLLPAIAENADVFTTGVSPSGAWVSGFSASRAVIWDQADHVVDVGTKLPTFGGMNRGCQAWDVNDSGRIIGRCLVVFEPPQSENTAYVFIAYAWSNRTDEVTVLNPEMLTPPITPNKSTWARVINNDGVIAGTISGGAVRWWPRPDGTYRREDLGGGYPTAINSMGDVVGYVDNHAVLWPADSSVAITLPPRPGAAPDESASAEDITDAGVIVGSTYLSGVQLPLIWPALAARPAETLDPDSGSASADSVNAHGTVVGAGRRGDQWRVLVWDP
jgi:hypothetical protein